MPLHSHFMRGLKTKISEREWWTRKLLWAYIIRNLTRDISQQALKIPDQIDFRIFSNQFWLFLWLPPFSVGAPDEIFLSLYHYYISLVLKSAQLVVTVQSCLVQEEPSVSLILRLPDIIPSGGVCCKLPNNPGLWS